ncbi:MAG: HEAT repeat domain-containing protein [Promethearchaeota archaeon]
MPNFKMLIRSGIIEKSFKKLLKNKNVDIRQVAAKGLEELKDPQAIELLIQVMNDKSFRKIAKRSVREMKDRHDIKTLVHGFNETYPQIANALALITLSG